MDESQTYRLKWNNHKSNLTDILDGVHTTGLYEDCTIVVDNRVQFRTHRIVLAANSPYLKLLLQNIPLDQGHFLIPGVEEYAMRTLLEYMYKGEVNVQESQMSAVFSLAEELEVRGLFEMTDVKEEVSQIDVEEMRSEDNSIDTSPFIDSTISGQTVDSFSHSYESSHNTQTNSNFLDQSYEDTFDFKPPEVQPTKPEWKRYKQYTHNDVMSAIECVRNGMSALQASRRYGVPSRTLYDKVKKMGINSGRSTHRLMSVRRESSGANVVSEAPNSTI